jgi:hypothetical protein
VLFYEALYVETSSFLPQLRLETRALQLASSFLVAARSNIMAPPKRKSSDDNDDVVFVSSRPRSKAARQHRPYADPEPRNAHSKEDREAWSSQPSSSTTGSSQPSRSTARSSQPSSSAARPVRPYDQGYVYSQPDRNNPVIVDDEEEAVGEEILALIQDSFDDATYHGYELYGG